MDTNIAWAAGFIDADGTITIKRCKRGKDRKWNYLPYIAVSQKDGVMGNLAVSALKKLFGGNVYRWTSTQNMKLLDGKTITAYKRNNTVNWQITSLGASNCIDKIYPHLVSKKNQGKILIEFISKFYRGVKYRAHWLTDKDRNERLKYFEKMRVFNVKGFAPTTTKREDTERSLK